MSSTFVIDGFTMCPRFLCAVCVTRSNAAIRDVSPIMIKMGQGGLPVEKWQSFLHVTLNRGIMCRIAPRNFLD